MVNRLTSKYTLVSATYEAAHYPLHPEHIITALEYITGQLHVTSFILAGINLIIMPIIHSATTLRVSTNFTITHSNFSCHKYYNVIQNHVAYEKQKIELLISIT